MEEMMEDVEDSILYELLVYAEWSQEHDVIVKGVENSQWSWQNLSSYWSNSSSACYISSWVDQQLPWLFAVGANGKAVAILQDNFLEIRTSRDSYSAPIGKTLINKDLNQHWRKLEWSPDGTLLAVAFSNGSVDVYDLLASHLFSLPPTRGSVSETATQKSVPVSAIAGLAFIDSRTKNTHWSYELLCLDHYGQLRAFFVSPTQGYLESHTFSFASSLPYGVTGLCADQSRNMLVVATPTITPSELNPHGNNQGVNGAKYGLTSWRILDDRPCYTQIQNEADLSPHRWFQSFQKKFYGNTVVKLSLSPDGSSLAAIHLSGAVSVWSLPRLRCLHFWPIDRQPGYDELNPTVLQLPAHRRVRNPAFQNPFKFHPIDVSWWSSDSIILARCSGAVSVCVAANLRNKLGSSAEFFEGSPRISPAFDNTFLGLECEVKVQRKRLQPTTDEPGASDDDEIQEDVDELSEDEEQKAMAHRAMRSLLYWVTDSERFRPPRKRPKLLAKTYRLLGFKRTTPDELYIWKLDAEEYGEALALARAYGLDCDLVHQRQWRNAPATIATIHDYLSKVTKRNWVLRECLERVPNDVDAARELLLYGLKNTDLAVVSDVEGKEQNKAAWSALEYQETEAEVLRREEEQRRKWLEKIDFDNLTVQQKMLISTRRRLLQFLDRLSIYEKILGGPHAAGQSFDPTFFEAFRSQSALESTAGFARQGDHKAVADMFTFNGPQTLPHRLAICSCFPETLLPTEYCSVLPECDVGGEVFLWEQQELRKPDWCECPAARMAVDAERVLEAEAVERFYGEEPNLRQFRSAGVELTTDLVSLWYRTRGADIEKQSMLVDNALDLIRLGLERNVPHLESIHHELLTLETLVYDLHHEHLNLEKLNTMSELGISQLFMSGCDVETFLPKLHHWLMPYLRRLDTQQPGRINELLRGLLVARSQESLDWALQVCANSKSDQASPIVADASFLISMALDCIYACQRTDQLEVAMKIYDCLPERPSGSKIDPVLTRLHDQLDQLQSHLEAADILENHDVALTPATIAAKQNDEEQLEQLFVRLTRTAMRKGQPPTENRWKELLDDMLELQSKVFKSISPQLCYEILVGSLLSSARKESIASAGLMLRLDPNIDSKPSQSTLESGHRKSLEMAVIPYERSKQLILQAAEEYFNSSENLSDPSLELASYCLGLVTIDDEQIQEEKDLVSAVQLLYDYGLDMPPLKIRLSKNRLLLIDQVLKQAGKAYKNSSRLLRLGHLLRASNEKSSPSDGDRRKELEGHIYVRIAETALVKQDLDVAGQMCNRLRIGNHPNGWKVCSRLAKLDEVADLNMKLELLSYSLVYCPADSIEELLQLRWKLEHKQLGESCCKQIEMYMNYENGKESLLALVDQPSVESYRQGVARKQQSESTAKMSPANSGVPQQVLQTTADTTMQLVNVVKSSLKRKEARQAEKAAKRTSAAWPSEDNKECIRWGLCVFYWDCWCDGGIGLHESHLGASYRLFSLPEMANSELNLLMWSWRMLVLDSLQEPYTAGRGRLRDDVLAKLAECLFPEDCLLALGHLLDLEEAAAAWEPLIRLPSTEITLQSAAYYFALRMIRLSSPDDFSKIASIRPRSLIERCLSLGEKKGLSKEEGACRDLLKRSLRLLADVSEAQQLRRLDGGVDINRFTTDDLYKRDTIVGLAITTDPTVYSAAVRLAAHYGVSAWEVTFSHLTALFAEEKIAAGQISKHMEEHRMRDTLLADVETLGRKMVDVIYPSISGRDYARLLLFFKLLNSNPLMAGLTQPPAPVFIQILRKVESIKVIDVKKLTRSVQGFVEEIESVATAENVGKLAKLAQLISSTVKSLSTGVSQATVHSIWTRKYFFQLADEAKHVTVTDWLHRFESCKSHANKLAAQEFLNLVDGLCFSDRSLDVLTLDIRAELCRRCLKMAIERDKAKTGNDSCVAESCRLRLEKWAEHLERLGSDEYGQIRTEVILTAGSQLWREFERSRAEETALRRLLLRVLVDRQPMSLVRMLVGIFHSDLDWTPEEVLFDAIRLTLEHLRADRSDQDGEPVSQPEQPLLAGKDALQVLLHLLTEVGRVNSEDGGGVLISQSDVGEMLRRFYEDDKIDVQIRLQLMLMLQTLPGDFVGPSESGSRVQWLRTLALIQQSWSVGEEADSNNLVGHLREEDLRSEERRRALFDRLLEMSHTIAQLASLAKLLHFWPPFESESNPHSTPWAVLWTAMTKLTSFPTDPSVLDSLKLAMEQKPALSEQCIRLIYQTVNVVGSPPSADAGHITRLRLHMALRSSVPFLLEDMVRFVEATQELSDEDYDQEILDLILDRGLVGRLAGTTLYGPLCERLLSSSQPASRVEDVARQLVHHGHRSEAGHLLELTSGLPRYLLNLSTSLYFARKRLL